MNSPFANIYLSIMARIKTKVPAVRYVNQDLGQLENYNPSTGRPAVSFPCVLIDFDDFNADDLTHNIQELEGDLILRIALDTWSSASSLNDATTKAKALAYYDIEQEVYKALHGYCPGNMDFCGNLTRKATGTEKRSNFLLPRNHRTTTSSSLHKKEDPIRVRTIIFKLRFKDISAAETQRFTRPMPAFTADIL